MARRPKNRTYVSGNQAKTALDLHAKVGGAGKGNDIVKKLAAEGNGAAAMAAAARVSAIRKARAGGTESRGQYEKLVRENRQARLDYNTRNLGLNDGPGKTKNFSVTSAKGAQALSNKKITDSTGRANLKQASGFLARRRARRAGQL